MQGCCPPVPRTMSIMTSTQAVSSNMDSLLTSSTEAVEGKATQTKNEDDASVLEHTTVLEVACL